MADYEYTTTNGVTRVAFSPAWLGIAIRPTVEGGGIPVSANDVLARYPEALVAVTGPLFSCCPSQSQCDANAAAYRAYTCAVPDQLLLDSNRGVNFPTQFPSRGSTISVGNNGVAQMTPQSQVPAGARVAVQGFPTLVQDGRNIASSTSNNLVVTWRPALGILSDGRMAFFIGQASMPGLADKMIAQGAVQSVYLDGGGSSGLVTRAEGFVGDPEHRRIPTWLIVTPPRMGTLGALAIGVPLGVVLAVSGIWAYDRLSR